MPRTPRQTPPATGDKAAKFVKLAQTRTQKALDALDVLGNCFNRANYEYTDEQTEKIFTTLRAKIDALEASTKPDAPAKSGGFTL
jgi:hypothetical protein